MPTNCTAATARDIEVGNNAEAMFGLFARKARKAVQATKQQDMVEHWDWMLDGAKYEVKCGKADKDTGKQIVLVETHNGEHRGWVFGKAHWLACQDKNDPGVFHCFNMDALRAWVKTDLPAGSHSMQAGTSWTRELIAPRKGVSVVNNYDMDSLIAAFKMMKVVHNGIQVNAYKRMS